MLERWKKFTDEELMALQGCLSYARVMSVHYGYPIARDRIYEEANIVLREREREGEDGS